MARVLIIEDEEATRKLYSTALAIEGHTVLEAKNGMEGLSMALRNEPDIILLDYRLPDTTGLEVLKLLNNDSKLSIPVVIITNYVAEIDQQNMIDHGAKEILLKPKLTPNILLKKVTSYLGGGKDG